MGCTRHASVTVPRPKQLSQGSPHNRWGETGLHLTAHGQVEGFQDPGWDRETRGTGHRSHMMFSKSTPGEAQWTAAQDERLNDEQRWQD